MLNCSDLEIDLLASFGQNYFVTDIETAYKWVDGKMTDIEDGYRVHIVLPDKRYEKITVKVAQKPESVIYQKKNCIVSFENLKVYFYSVNQKCYFSLKADAIRLKQKINVES